MADNIAVLVVLRGLDEVEIESLHTPPVSRSFETPQGWLRINAVILSQNMRCGKLKRGLPERRGKACGIRIDLEARAIAR